jgi:hypothetical protein
MNCCDQNAHGCHQGRDCPVRKAGPAMVAKPTKSIKPTMATAPNRCNQLGVCQGISCPECPNEPLHPGLLDHLDPEDLAPHISTDEWLSWFATALLLLVTGAIVAGVAGYVWGRWGDLLTG